MNDEKSPKRFETLGMKPTHLSEKDERIREREGYLERDRNTWRKQKDSCSLD